ncbi:hypothetical protein BG74_08340 [Sodalis-like endosymbiont of Proechinophthirus fluctus]|nr:hypothetical protein BG74_08340 [Sodalis-like endosymbiont of Proechinophthirus fluctus]
MLTIIYTEKLLSRTILNYKEKDFLKIHIIMENNSEIIVYAAPERKSSRPTPLRESIFKTLLAI